MRSAFGGGDIVHVRVDVFREIGRVLQGDFDADSVDLSGEVNHVMMHRFADAVQVLDELDDAAFVLECVAVAGTLILEDDSHALIQESQFLQAAVERVVVELGGLEDLRVGLEGGLGADFVRAADASQLVCRHAARVFLLINVPIAAHFNNTPFGKKIHHRNPNAVQPAGGLIDPLVKLAAELKDRHHAFDRGYVTAEFFGQVGMAVDRDAAAVVYNGDGAVGMHGHAHLRSELGHRLINGIIDDLVDHMM